MADAWNDQGYAEVKKPEGKAAEDTKAKKRAMPHAQAEATKRKGALIAGVLRICPCNLVKHYKAKVFGGHYKIVKNA